MADNALLSPIPLGTGEEYNGIHNATELPDYTDFWGEIPPYDVTVVTMLVCFFLLGILGLLGNGSVIWFLGFCMKRTPFTTYILNLAVADFGVLLGSVPWRLIAFLDRFHPHLVNLHVYHLAVIASYCFFSMNFISQFLLTALGIDSCVSVSFPIWHRCRRPPNLSIIVCAILWSLAFLLSLVQIINVIEDFVWYHLLVSAVFCLPLMTVSTLILFIKVCLRLQQKQQGTVLIAILVALLFSLLFAFPFSFLYLIFSYPHVTFPNALNIGILSCCINSSIKPLIYFLVGRRKRDQPRESMKVIFQRLFKEEEDCREEVEVPIQT